MSGRRRSHIPQKRLVYIGCEGASESGYAALIQDLVNAARIPVYFKIDELAPGAGDPLARIERAVRHIEHLKRKRTAPAASFVFLDNDQTSRDVQRAARARHLAAENRISIIWQHPCFEAMLLRHLPNHAGRRPPDTQRAEQALLREWPEYQKPMPRALLGRRINRPEVLQAATVEPELAELLKYLGLI